MIVTVSLLLCMHVCTCVYVCVIVCMHVCMSVGMSMSGMSGRHDSYRLCSLLV